MFGTRMLASARRAVFIGALVWIAPSSFAAKPTPKPAANSAAKPSGASVEHGGGSANKEAQALIDAGDFDGAIALLTEQITKNPKAWHSYYQRGLASLRKVQKAQAQTSKENATNVAGNKDLDAAVTDLNKALELAPADPDALIARGEAREEMGQYDQAVEDYTAVLSKNPKNEKALKNRARAYSKSGQDEKAKADRGAAAKVNPKKSPE